uniref:dUTPase-like domain-containing protein n=1 Tax=Apteryx owenii TaxID=8824 RepID=A0A8B9QCB6_APTOW
KISSQSLPQTPPELSTARPEQSNKCRYKRLVSKLVPATRGSAGLDLAVNESVTLTSTAVSLIPTGVWGPLRQGLHGLLIRRSSTTNLGLFILPGIIDSDYQGEIKSMAWTPVPPCYVPKGQRIAQIVPFCSMTPQGVGERKTGGFGSTGTPQIYWAQAINSSQWIKNSET